MGMRLINRLAAVAAGATAVLLAVPGVAQASSVTVTPTTVAPGERITVQVVCKSAGHETVKVFWGRDVHHPKESKEVRLRDGAGSTSFTIPRGTEPSRYLAGTFCPKATHATTAHFTVAPRGAPHAGFGPDGEGGGVVLIAGATVLAAAAAGAFLLLRRRTGGVT